VHKAVRSEIGGLKIFEIGEKYYFEDMGLRNAIVGFNQRADLHKLMENAVYLYLKQQNYQVFVGKLGDKEIDFVGDKNGAKIYVQVCLTIIDESTANREFGNLLKIEDNYPKYVITLNDILIGQGKDGIIQKNLIDFLTEQL
jgi:predicted AAA+ superfamily ATPase